MIQNKQEKSLNHTNALPIQKIELKILSHSTIIEKVKHFPHPHLYFLSPCPR